MRTVLGLVLSGLATLAVTGSAMAQQAAPQAASLQVTPNGTVTAPGGAVGGFDTPKPALTLQAPADSAAVRGLAPGQDLVGDAGLGNRRRPAAETDTYFASQDYQQKAETIERKGHQSIGKQFAGAGEAAAANLAIGGVGLLINGN